MAAAGAGGRGELVNAVNGGKPVFNPENIFILIAHGFDAGDRRFFLRPLHHLTLPKRCGTTVWIDLEGIYHFFKDDYSNVPVPMLGNDPRNVEKAIGSIGFNYHNTKPIQKKLYRSEFRNENPELSINQSFSRFTVPDLFISLIYIDKLKGTSTLEINGETYKNVKKYMIRINGIYRQTNDPIITTVKQTIPSIPEIKFLNIKSKSRGKYIYAEPEEATAKYLIPVYGPDNDVFLSPLTALENPVEQNFLRQLESSITDDSMLTFNEYKILCWFRKIKKRDLTVDELLDIGDELEQADDERISHEDWAIKSVKYIENPEINEDEFYDDYIEEENDTGVIYLNLDELTLNDLIHFNLRLSFLMDLIDMYVDKGEPFLVNVHACRTTDISVEERQERADASENEGYSAAATRRLKMKHRKPGGKSRHTRKAKAGAAAANENNE